MKRIFIALILISLTFSLFATGNKDSELTARTLKIDIPSFTLFDENKSLDKINNTLYSDVFKLLNGPEDTSDGFRSWDTTVYISESTMTCQNKIMASFTTTQYVYYYHAAHGMHLLLGYIFDIETGEKLTLNDIFTGEGYKTKTLDFMKDEIKTKQIPIFSDTEFKGIDENTEFYLEEDHLVFAFQEYEYTPYCEGFLIFRIPLEYLKEDLNEKYF